MERASYKPNDSEIAQLVTLVQMPGFEVLRRIMLGEVDWFQIDLMNVDPSSQSYETEVRVKHNLALAAGMFYERINKRVSSYISDLGAKQEQRQVQADPTEELFG